jgi:hypothetical protein
VADICRRSTLPLAVELAAQIKLLRSVVARLEDRLGLLIGRAASGSTASDCGAID